MSRHFLSTSIAAAVFGLVFMANAKEASAVVNVNNPFGATAVNARVGTIFGEPWVAWQPTAGGGCAFNKLGTVAGLNNDFNIIAGGGNDSMLIHNFTGTFCGFTISALVYNGHFADLFGSGGADNMSNPGNGDTWFFMGADNDIGSNAGTVGGVFGEDGNDKVFGTSTTFDNILNGGNGNDCLAANGNAAFGFECGPGTDTKIGNPPNATNCEITAAVCP